MLKMTFVQRVLAIVFLMDPVLSGTFFAKFPIEDGKCYSMKEHIEPDGKPYHPKVINIFTPCVKITCTKLHNSLVMEGHTCGVYIGNNPGCKVGFVYEEHFDKQYPDCCGYTKCLYKHKK